MSCRDLDGEIIPWPGAHVWATVIGMVAICAGLIFHILKYRDTYESLIPIFSGIAILRNFWYQTTTVQYLWYLRYFDTFDIESVRQRQCEGATSLSMTSLFMGAVVLRCLTWLSGLKNNIISNVNCFLKLYCRVSLYNNCFLSLSQTSLSLGYPNQGFPVDNFKDTIRLVYVGWCVQIIQIIQNCPVNSQFVSYRHLIKARHWHWLSGHRFLNSTGLVGQWFQYWPPSRLRNPTLHRNNLNNISLFINVRFVTFYL